MTLRAFSTRIVWQRERIRQSTWLRRLFSQLSRIPSRRRSQGVFACCRRGCLPPKICAMFFHYKHQGKSFSIPYRAISKLASTASRHWRGVRVSVIGVGP